MSSIELTDGWSWGGQPIARQIVDVSERCRVLLTGTIVAAGTVAFGSGPAYRCTLDDGTDQLDLLFVGRSELPGLGPGARCSVEGTASREGHGYTVWNPLYRLEVPAAETVWPSPPGAGPTEPRGEAGAVAADGGGAPSTADTSGPAEVSDMVEAAGHFRIYLGAAAGVGKTLAMLDEGHRRRQRGADVVVGFAECHGRAMTEARLAGLEVVPRRQIRHRGVTFEEMDLDAVLRRHPAVALVDELAHTNVPGSGRHEKRWQDVLELLDAGIDVITTVNIQHLESIADAVEEITGAPVRERVPDWVVRRANQIELVDSSPEQLRRRMLHGNIYPREQVSEALTHFFRTDNLTALRELALRFLADETEENLLERLRAEETGIVWDTAERLMVGVTAAPGTEAIIRRASRMALRIKAELHVVHVAGGDLTQAAPRDRLDQLRQVAIDVGATWHELEGDDIVETLLDFARRQQITQIVLGASRRSRWQELIRGGSIARRVTRRAADADVDVHIIARRRIADAARR